MKYYLKVREDKTILRLLKVKPVKKIIGGKTIYHYEDFSSDFVEITNNCYEKLIKMNNLPYTKYIDGIIIDETDSEKDERILKYNESVLLNQKEEGTKKLKELFNKLKDLFVLSDEGIEFLKDIKNG